MRRPVVASSSPRSIRSQSGSTPEGAPTGTARFPRAGERGAAHLPLLGKERAIPGPGQNQNSGSCDPFHPRGHSAMARHRERSCGSWRRRRAVRSFGQTGTDRVGWYACPRLTLFATEWSAARKNPMRAAALHFSARFCRRQGAQDFDERPPKISVRKFSNARDLEAAKRVSRGQAYRQTSTVPVCPKDRTARLRHRNLSSHRR